MKLLIVGINYAPEPTGIAPYTATMAEGLQRIGHEVEVLTGIPHYPNWSNYTGFKGMSRTEKIGGVLVHRLRHVIRGGVGIGRILQEVTFGVHSVAHSWRRVDVIVTVSPALLASGLLVARARLLGGPPVVVWVQDLYSNGAEEIKGASLQTRLLTWLEGVVLRNGSGVIAIHERFRTRLAGSLGVPADRILVSRNWSHLTPAGVIDDVVETRTRLFGNARIVALHTGNMGAKQGLENVIEAARLADVRGEDVVFGLVGDGSDRARLQRLAEGVQRVRFLPPLPSEDYQAALCCADVLLVNEKIGLREMAVPSKLTSYFFQGAPVVAATEADSTTAFEINSAKAGVVVPPGDPQRLLDSTLSIAMDREKWHEYAANGRRYAAEVLNAEVAVGRVSEWLQSVATSRTGAADAWPATKAPL